MLEELDRMHEECASLQDDAQVSLLPSSSNSRVRNGMLDCWRNKPPLCWDHPASLRVIQEQKLQLEAQQTPLQLHKEDMSAALSVSCPPLNRLSSGS